MKSLIVNCLGLLAIMSTPTSSAMLLAQIPQLRTVVRDYNENGSHGFLVVLNTSPTLVWHSMSPLLGGISGTASLPLPFDRVQSISAMPGFRFLVSGVNAATSTSWLLRVQLDFQQQSITSLEQAQCPGIDIANAAWSPQQQLLYIADMATTPRRIIAAAWDGASTLPSLAQFSTAATTLTVPVLANETPVRFIISEPAGWLKVSSLGTGSACYSIHWEANAWIVVDESIAPPVIGPRVGWEVVGSDFVNTRAPLWIIGPVGNYELHDLTFGGIVASGAVSTADVPHFVDLGSAELRAGAEYQFRSPNGVITSRPFAPLVRYGMPTVVGVYHAQEGRLPASKAHVDSPTFGVATELLYLPVPAEPVDESCDVYLWVDLLEPGAVIEVGSVAYLASPAAIYGPMKRAVRGRPAASGAAFTQPVPDDAGLVDMTFVWQFVISLPNQQVVVSDVFGVTLGADPTDSQQAQGAPKAPLSAADKRAAAWKWLGADARGQLTGDRQVLAEVLMSRIADQLKRR